MVLINHYNEWEGNDGRWHFDRNICDGRIQMRAQMKKGPT